MVLGIFALVIFLGVIGGMGFMVYKAMKQSDPKAFDTSTRDNIDTAQEFLSFEDIRDGMICLGGHQYRAVIECTSTNYNLKTDKEKELIEASFQRFLNSLTFPITFYVQTRLIDNSQMLEILRDELVQTMKEHPQLEDYANVYFQEMNNLYSYIGNNKQKKKYIIVPFDEGITLNHLSEEEKYDYSLKELNLRASIIVDGLQSVGVKARILNTKELAELVFSSYHKDNYTHVENVVNGEFLTMLVEGERNHEEHMSEDARLDWILYEAQMRIQNELMKEDVPEFYRQNFETAIQQLNELRDQTSGYYKTRIDDYNESFDKKDLEDASIDFEHRLRTNLEGGMK